MLKPPRVPLPHVRATAYDRIAFLADHFPQLVEMYECIMEHLKIPGGEVSGGDCKWVDEKSDTFIPIYIEFIKNNPVTVTPEIARGMDIVGATLYYVTEDEQSAVYAVPIPFIAKANDDPYIFLPEVMHLNYNGFIADDGSSKTFIPKGTFELLQGHMVEIVNVFELCCYAYWSSSQIDTWDDTIEENLGLPPSGYVGTAPYYNIMGYPNEWDSPFGLYSTSRNFTPFTFSSIKPEDNKHIYLGE